MRDEIIFFALIIAGIVFCCALACNITCEIGYFADCKGFFKENLNVIANCGTFMATCFAAFYGIKEYSIHKVEEKIKLLGEYNQRYSTDKNIKTVVSWMLKIAILNEKGDIVGANPDKTTHKPGIYEKEMFMRFFEELYLHIKNGSVEKRQACLLFSYYAIKFDEIENFRLDISDYKSKDELMNEELKDPFSKYWASYRMFIEDMRNEWEKYADELKIK